MDVIVVARRPQSRWAVVAALGLPAAAACGPDLAASRLAHPSSPRPDAVLLLVEDRDDLDWLRRQAARQHDQVPVVVVAAVASSELADGARSAGARTVVASDASAGALGRALRAAMAPAPVVDLDGTRTA